MSKFQRSLLAASASLKLKLKRNAKIELAIEMYREGKWSTRRAGEFAGMDRRQFMDVLMARKIEAPYTNEMLEQDIAYASGRL